ncbi:MAG: minor capsid protein [Rhodospirillaceae bacterium]|nr:minor capsid protein [Rhodospirillaceae bacterium]
MSEIAKPGTTFQEAVAYVQGKVRLPTTTWTDLKEGAHARSFVVSGATTDALLADFQGAVDQAIREGRTKQDFLKDFDAIVARHGWDYNGGRKWRARVIYNTNLRMAYAAGRWQQAMELDDPIGRYTAVLDVDTRDEHRQWHGITLPLSHPFWRTHWPPNGWGCRCSVIVLPRREALRQGWQISEAPTIDMERRIVNGPNGPEEWWTPKGIDTGFGYNVGESWLQGAVPQELRNPLPPFGTPIIPKDLPPLPKPHTPDADRTLPDDLTREGYVQAFLSEFGADLTRPASFRDVAGHRFAVGRELFDDRSGNLRKADKFGRQRYLLHMADALKDPDEIWLDWAQTDKGVMLRRRYLRVIDMPDHAGGIAVFEWSGAGWSGVTAFPPERAAYLERQRQGVLLFRRK